MKSGVECFLDSFPKTWMESEDDEDANSLPWTPPLIRNLSLEESGEGESHLPYPHQEFSVVESSHCLVSHYWFIKCCQYEC